MHPSKRKALALFDLDGVILDSRGNMEAAWQAVQEELGISTPFEAYFAEIGRPFSDIMARLGLAGRASEIEAVFRRVSSRLLSDVPLYSGMTELLTALAADGLRLGIVTSKDAARTQLVLDRLPACFAIVMTPREGLRGKPAPDPLLAAMARCNVDPADSVFIGDMLSDAEAARRARIDYIHVAWGYGNAPPDATFCAAAASDLRSYLLGR